MPKIRITGVQFDPKTNTLYFDGNIRQRVQLSTEVQGILTFKDCAVNLAALPSEGNTKNDARFVNDTGHLYVWDGSSWVDQGNILDISWDDLVGKPESTPEQIDAHLVKLTNNATYYIDPTGDDETGDGSLANPWQSLEFALSQLPKDFNGFSAEILLKNGTYAIGNIMITGFYSSDVPFFNLPPRLTIRANSSNASDVIISSGKIKVQANQIVLVLSNFTTNSDSDPFVEIYNNFGHIIIAESQGTGNKVQISAGSLRFNTMNNSDFVISMFENAIVTNGGNNTAPTINVLGGIYINENNLVDNV